MGCYLSQVQFPQCKKLYWFRSDQRPQINSECVAWARGKQTRGIIANTCYAKNQHMAVETTHIDFRDIAPLISYATYFHSDSISVSIQSIRIDPQYWEHLPRPERIMEKYREIVCEAVNLPLVVERSTNTLKDGFAAYLVYTMLRRDPVPVVYVESVEK